MKTLVEYNVPPKTQGIIHKVCPQRVSHGLSRKVQSMNIMFLLLVVIPTGRARTFGYGNDQLDHCR
jgi:hypothetical protein